MYIFPAIDLYGGRAVRLYKGDYAQMTVYSDHPEEVAASFRAAGAEHLHMVDLEGAKTGGTPNMETVRKIVKESELKVQIGGGIRSMAVIDAYLSAGVFRVILGTAAVADPAFLKEAVRTYGEKIAVGVDIKDGYVATHGWTQLSGKGCLEFCRELDMIGVRTVVCTDISRDGVLGGTNVDLYRELSSAVSLDIIASGGVTTHEDIAAVKGLGLYGAIIGKALYEGKIDLKKAIAIARDDA